MLFIPRSRLELCTLFIYKALVAARTRLPLMIEFQDPLPFQYEKKFRRLALLVEKWAMKRACCIFLTRQAARAAAYRCGTSIPPHIYPGAKEMIREEYPAHQDKLRLAHFGRLYRNRNTASFHGALESFLKNRPELQTVLQFHCYGAMDRDAHKATRLTIPEVFHLHDKISRAHSLRLMCEMDVLLLIQHLDDVSSQTIPSKVYEYLQTGRPILALTYRNPELTRMLRELGHVTVEVDNEQAIREALETIVQNWKLRTSLFPVSSYSTRKAAETLLEVVV